MSLRVTRGETAGEMEGYMRRAILSLLLLSAGCTKSNPLSPVTDTLRSDNLQITFSIPRPSFGAHDTLVATTTVYNPADTTVDIVIPVCWPIAWYTVQDTGGTTRLSYTAPGNLGCNSLVRYSIPPHQTQQIVLLGITVAIVDLDGTRSGLGSYVLTVANVFGKFSLKFTVD